MRSILVAAFWLVSAPAFAGSCYFSNDDGDRLAFAPDGQNMVSIAEHDGSKLACTWAVTPEGSSYFGIECADGSKAPFFFGSSKLHGTARDLLAFENQIWHSSCEDAGL